jgi:hypothetical protein
MHKQSCFCLTHADYLLLACVVMLSQCACRQDGFAGTAHQWCRQLRVHDPLYSVDLHELCHRRRVQGGVYLLYLHSFAFKDRHILYILQGCMQYSM